MALLSEDAFMIKHHHFSLLKFTFHKVDHSQFKNQWNLCFVFFFRFCLFVSKPNFSIKLINQMFVLSCLQTDANTVQMDL